jgi:FkbM family methyltransferase
MINIVQIGIADANDHVKDFIFNNLNNVNIFLVEPNKYSIPIIESVYKDVIFKSISNLAITTFDGKVEMHFMHYETGNSQAASISRTHVERHNTGNMLPIVSDFVDCVTMNNFLQNIVKVATIDYLFIDTEGHDCDIILSTDLNKFNIKKIIFEKTHSEGPFMSGGENLNKTISYLRDHGYSILNETWGDSGNICFGK